MLITSQFGFFTEEALNQIEVKNDNNFADFENGFPFKNEAMPGKYKRNMKAYKLLASAEDAIADFMNRIVMAPMTRCRAIGNLPNNLMAKYYGQRSAAGLIITEGTSPSPNGLGYARIPGIFSSQQAEGWKKTT